MSEPNSDDDFGRLMDDIGLPLPAPAGLKVDQKASRLGLIVAGHARHDYLKFMKAELEKTPDSMINILLGVVKDIAYRRNDELNDQTVSDAKAPLSIACRKGCAWCCHQNVEVSIPEAILIAVETSAPGDIRGSATDRAAEAFSGLNDIARAKTGQPCPFLNSELECSIYEIRPFACRSFYSPDATRCEAGYRAVVSGLGDVTVISHGMPQILGCAYRASINGLVKDLGLQHDDVDLVSTVAAIRKDPNLIERWARGEHVFVARMKPENRPRAAASPN
jgi:hypothetical protein